MSLITPRQVEDFHELGYFVTEPILDENLVRQMSDEFDRVLLEFIGAAAAADPRHAELARLRPFIGQFHTQSAVAREFVRQPIYLEACSRFIGPDADLYYNQAVIKPPEKGLSFGWHQDSGYKVTRPLEYITCWTAISDTTLENGCIWVIPGSHKLGLIEHVRDTQSAETRPRQIDESNAIPVPMKAGQIAIFSSLTLHKSGPNTSTTTRKGYVPQYHVPGVVAALDGKPFGDQLPVLRNGQRVD